ncbi:MAG: molybdate transport system substrate-binding protein [Gammaproteobacteria bacterium]
MQIIIVLIQFGRLNLSKGRFTLRLRDTIPEIQVTSPLFSSKSNKLTFSWLLITLLMFVIQLQITVNAADRILIAAASSIRFPLDRLISQFETENPDIGPVSIIYGASGKLTHQILKGAPFGLFLSANISYPDRISAAGLTFEKPQIYTEGSLSLYANNQSNCQIDRGLNPLLQQLEARTIVKIAIANPQLAPYGVAAKQALIRAKIYENLKDNLIYANNVSQAAQFAISGAADCAIISTSIAESTKLSDIGTSKQISTDFYQPISHAMVLMNWTTKPTNQLYQYLKQPAAQLIFQDHGFKIPSIQY